MQGTILQDYTGQVILPPGDVTAVSDAALVALLKNFQIGSWDNKTIITLVLGFQDVSYPGRFVPRLDDSYPEVWTFRTQSLDDSYPRAGRFVPKGWTFRTQ